MYVIDLVSFGPVLILGSLVVLALILAAVLPHEPLNEWRPERKFDVETERARVLTRV